MNLADQFDSLSDFSTAVDSYFGSFFTKEEQAAARTAQFATVFQSLGVAMPNTLGSFRALVEAQDLTSAAGQETYATLLKLAPAFADLQTSLLGAKSAADILSEREDLQKQLLELNGDTAAIRAAQLATLDPSNQALQQQIYAIQDAQAAAQAAEQLKEAWTSVGDSIEDEIKRIRGLTANDNVGGFATLTGQFNAASAAARAGDQDAAKSLPGLSQALLTAAADAATSRQELDRIQAQTAASLEQTFNAISALSGSGSTLDAAAAASAGGGAASSDSTATSISDLKQEFAQLRADLNAGNAAIVSPLNRVAKKLDDVTAAGNGEAIAVTSIAA
jgi:DNA repair exonuclease SbcCD ATPase subunit